MPDTLADFVNGLDKSDRKIFEPPLLWWRKTTSELGHLPSRADLTPDQLTPAALPHVMLVDVADGGNKLRWRLVGTAHVDRNRENLMGTDFDGAYAKNSPVLIYIKNLYREIIQLKKPIWTVNDIVHHAGNFGTDSPLFVRRLMLPLSSNGNDVDLCIGVQTVTLNPELNQDYRELWRNSDYVSETEKIIIT
jgi:hypothetical protein